MAMRQGSAIDAWIKYRAKQTPEHKAAWEAAKADLAKAKKAMNDVMEWASIAERRLDWARMADAVFDDPIAIDSWGEPCAHDSPDAVTGGHPDWYIRLEKHVELVDVKSSAYDQGEPDQLPQLVDYATILCAITSLPVAPGIYYARTGVLVMGKPRMFPPTPIVRAALLPDVPVIGEQCNDCWQRKNCPDGLAATVPSFPLAEAGR